jgi:succinate-acetate transporter protein
MAITLWAAFRPNPFEALEEKTSMGEEQKMTWSLPLSVVLYGTGTVAFVVGLMMAGQIPAASGATSAAWLLGLALIDIPAGIVMFRRGDTILGTITLYLGTILCVGAALAGLIRMLAPGGGAIPPAFDAWMWIGIGAFLLCLMPAVAKLPWSVFLFLCGACGFGLVLWGIGLLQNIVSLMHTGGWLIVVFAVFLYYAGTAALTNEAYQREVLPLGRPISK